MEALAHNIFFEAAFEGVNVGVIQTQEGIIAIDAPSYPKQARDWVLQLNAVHHKSIKNLILTDYNGDRILNSRWFNSPIIAHSETARTLSSYDRRYPTAMLESLIARQPELGRPLTTSPVEKVTFSFSDDLCLYKGQYAIQLIAMPGPTKGNVWVHIPEERVLFVGDTLSTSIPPLILDGNSAHWISSLQILKEWQNKVDVIVPGRGSLETGSAIEAHCRCLELMQQRMTRVIEEERPFAEVAMYISEFIERYPNHNMPLAWMRQQIHKTLNHIYHEIKFAKDGIVMRIENEFE